MGGGLLYKAAPGQDPARAGGSVRAGSCSLGRGLHARPLFRSSCSALLKFESSEPQEPFLEGMFFLEVSNSYFLLKTCGFASPFPFRAPVGGGWHQNTRWGGGGNAC